MSNFVSDANAYQPSDSATGASGYGSQVFGTSQSHGADTGGNTDNTIQMKPVACGGRRRRKTARRKTSGRKTSGRKTSGRRKGGCSRKRKTMRRRR